MAIIKFIFRWEPTYDNPKRKTENSIHRQRKEDFLGRILLIIKCPKIHPNSLRILDDYGSHESAKECFEMF